MGSEGSGIVSILKPQYLGEVTICYSVVKTHGRDRLPQSLSCGQETGFKILYSLKTIIGVLIF